MKSKYIYFLITLIFFLPACTEKLQPETNEAKLASVPEIAMGNIIKHTGTKCYYCGTWGWSTLEYLIENADNEMLIVAAYGNNVFAGSFVSDYATQLDEYYKIEGYPSFLANGSEIFPMGNDPDSMAQSMLEQAKTLHWESTKEGIEAGGALNWKVTDNMATINARFRFFQDCDATYFGTVWLDESGMQAPQDGQEDPNPVHKNALRTASTESVFGEEIASGKIPANHLVEKQWTIDFPESEWNKENTRASLVIYKKVKGAYLFVNASRTMF